MREEKQRSDLCDFRPCLGTVSQDKSSGTLEVKSMLLTTSISQSLELAVILLDKSDFQGKFSILPQKAVVVK